MLDDEVPAGRLPWLRPRRVELPLPTPFLLSGCMNLQSSPMRHQPLDFQWWHTMVHRLASPRCKVCCGVSTVPGELTVARSWSKGVGLGDCEKGPPSSEASLVLGLLGK